MRRLSAGLFVVLCLISPNALAATITVTNTNDSGPGSLRQKISEAAPGDTITFSMALPATIELTSAELMIGQDLTIAGPGADRLTVRRSVTAGTPEFRVFEIVNPARVTVSGMTLSNGIAIEGGAILSSGDLTLTKVVITGNKAYGNGGIGVYGGGGGAISEVAGQLTILNSTIDSNTCGDPAAFCVGGGIKASAYTPLGLRITGSTISNNVATFAGGLFLGYAGIDADVKNTTISGNYVFDPTATWGSALILLGQTNPNVAKFTAVTITGPAPSLVSLMSYGVIPRVEFRDTILASPVQTYAVNSGIADTISNGFNLATDTPGFLTAPGDQNSVDPLLDPLANYGGPTATHRLQSLSPAIDAGSCADAANAAIASDQRGMIRPQGPACDIGAFEVQADGLANLDVAVSTRATQASVDSVQTAVSSRASQVSVDAITGIVNGKLDAAISSRATQASVETVQNNLGSVQSGLGTVQSNLGTVQTGLGSVQNGLGAVQTNLGALATQTSVNQLGSSISSVSTGMGTLATQVSGVATQVTGLSSALDARVSTRASQASVDALAGQVSGALGLRSFIEMQLANGTRISSLYLPAAFGGNLETVRDVVVTTITTNKQAGIDVKAAFDSLTVGTVALQAGYYKVAYDAYVKAYQACIR